MTKIKICGITNLEDALLASDLGADALGFVFAQSSRRIDPTLAREIILSLPPFITKVGVFVNERKDVVRQIYRDCGLNVIQLHGDEDESYIGSLCLPLIKTYRVKDETVLAQIRKHKQTHFLLETFDQASFGGTGKTFDWSIGERATRLGRVILSGGLRPTNVLEVLRRVRPYGVDVCSGVERSPGRKDRTKLRLFIQEVRNWDSRID